jgi:hypothetical protein
MRCFPIIVESSPDMGQQYENCEYTDQAYLCASPYRGDTATKLGLILAERDGDRRAGPGPCYKKSVSD